jgi:hypothetical protein
MSCVHGWQGTDLSTVRKLTIQGSNLGALSTVTGTGQTLQLLSQARLPADTTPVPGLWQPLPSAQILSWVDDQIVAVSTQETAFLQVGSVWDV